MHLEHKDTRRWPLTWNTDTLDGSCFDLKSYNENNCNTDSRPILLGFRNNRTIVTPGKNKPCVFTDSLWIQLENLCAWLYVIRRPLRVVCPCLWPLKLKHRVNARASMLYVRAYACTRKYVFKNRGLSYRPLCASQGKRPWLCVRLRLAWLYVIPQTMPLHASCSCLW